MIHFLQEIHRGYRASLRKYLLSWTMLNVAVVNLLFAGANGLLRIRINRVGLANPDMLDERYWRAQMLLSAVQVVMIACLFGFSYWTLLRDYRRLIAEGKADAGLHSLRQRAMNAADQKNNTLPGATVLSGRTILQLMQLWAVILVGVKVVDVIFTDIYRSFIADLFQLFNLADSKSMALFRNLYNNTHAFKYVGMLIAISLGIFITGIFLSDRILKIAAICLMILFIASATFMQMGTYTFLSWSVAIVWSSVILQILQTLGLLSFSLYLSMRYQGI